MGEPKLNISRTYPYRAVPASAKRCSRMKTGLSRTSSTGARCNEEEQREIAQLAEQLVLAARAGRHEAGGVDSFLHEYGLSSREGVLLLCLAEALLRIPDAAHRRPADRRNHRQRRLGAPSRPIELAAGQCLDLGADAHRPRHRSGARRRQHASGMIQRLIGRSGEPVIRQALRQAMRILGGQFVLGQTIDEALAKSPRTRRSRATASPSTCWGRLRAPPPTRSAMPRAITRRSRPSPPGRVDRTCATRRSCAAARALGETFGAASALSARAGGAAAGGIAAAFARACACHA